MTHLFLIPLTPAAHQAVVELHERWGRSPPPYPSEAIIVADLHANVVVASCYLYECTPVLLAEFAAGNPSYSRRTLHEAATVIAEAIVARGTMKGQAIIAPVRLRGIELILERVGFRDSGSVTMVCMAPAVPLQVQKTPSVVSKTEGAPSKGSDADQGTADPPTVPRRTRGGSRVRV